MNQRERLIRVLDRNPLTMAALAEAIANYRNMIEADQVKEDWNPNSVIKYDFWKGMVEDLHEAVAD